MGTQESHNFDLLVIGELNLDLILNNLNSFPELGKEKIAHNIALTLGSSSAIFSANSARLGLSVGFCGMVGKDDFGKKVLKDLSDYKVDTSLIKQSSRHKTGITVILRHDNDRAMTTYPGTMEQFGLSDISEKAFKQAQHLHISSIFLQPKIKRDLFAIIDKAKAHGMTVSIDPQWDPSEKWDIALPKLLSKIDFFTPNETEFIALTNASTVEEGLQKICENNSSCSVIVKRGLQGASFLDDGIVRTIPTIKNEAPIDTVGAGDSFDAGFIYQIIQGNDISTATYFGNIVGAVSTTAAGGTEAIKSLEHVKNIAKEKFQIDDLTG
ncbi:carbohydrate kinase family protein [Fodinibius sp. Rm-B-1B1-1]|uniref:carbohydrate kinase family protein n=1 Tax=Fodinibius alkaliphilus TaxID=3140241 RepID=UPI00315AC4D1